MRYTPANIRASMSLWRCVGGEDRRIGWGFKPSVVAHLPGKAAYILGYLTPRSTRSRGPFSEPKPSAEVRRA